MARIKSIASRTNQGIVADMPGITGIEASHKERSIMWRIVTGGKGGRR